jgi:hypothetical protein
MVNQLQERKPGLIWLPTYIDLNNVDICEQVKYRVATVPSPYTVSREVFYMLTNAFLPKSGRPFALSLFTSQGHW